VDDSIDVRGSKDAERNGFASVKERMQGGSVRFVMRAKREISMMRLLKRIKN